MCSPTFTHRLTRCFPSFQNVFLQENALFSLSECAYFRAFSKFPVWFCAENVTYSFIHWCFRSKFNIRCCTFVFLGTCHKCFKRHTVLRFSPPYPSKAETSNEKLSMHFEFWILLYTATQSITYTIRVHNNIVCSTASIIDYDQSTANTAKLPFIRMHAILDKMIRFYAIKWIWPGQVRKPLTMSLMIINWPK